MTEPIRALMTALNFTDADLAANRRGLMSDVQRDRLSARTIEFRYYIYLMILIAFVFFGLGIAMKGGGVAILIGVVIEAVIGYFYAQSRSKLLGDLSSNRADVVEGTVTKFRRASHTGAAYYMAKIGEREFNLGLKAFELLQDGDRYRAYFTPNTHVLLSVEPA